ncbi:hypothetical protein [Thiothrix nivea]|uniref:Uncharacterized protein n=1 Tax=Thiothrix nivea (strain ATCC 35100 / DSM 5205 / JP2) TaxID=870187 RepID=A0A656HHB3_THINJ|nr:hypothetical protein [Thiothrix nivea]EIJ36308.1 hypothetical protein Thini_3807 [Thiothrix nivea DSM 5205]
MKKTIKWGTTALAFAAITINTAAFAGDGSYARGDPGLMDIQFNWTTHQSGDTVKANEPVKIGFEVGNAGMYIPLGWQYTIHVKGATIQSWDSAPGVTCTTAESKLFCSSRKPILKLDPFLKGSITVLPPAQSGRRMRFAGSMVALVGSRPDEATMLRDTNRTNDTKIMLEMSAQ